MPRKERYKDPFKGLTPEGKIQLGAQHLVGLTIMEGRDPETLFDEANREDTITDILTLARYEADDPELRAFALRVAGSGLSDVFEQLHKMN
jgi:hypothetical protein